MENKHGMILVCLLLLCGGCSGQKFSFGSCPTVTPQMITITGGLVGTWYEWARTPNIEVHGWRCTTYTIATIVTNRLLSVTVNGVSKITGSVKTASGTVSAVGSLTGAVLTGYLSVLFNNKPFGVSNAINYYVVASDATLPTAYIVLYACRNVGFGKLEYVIILTSMRTPATADTNAAYSAAVATGLSSSVIKRTDQNGC